MITTDLQLKLFGIIIALKLAIHEKAYPGIVDPFRKNEFARTRPI